MKPHPLDRIASMARRAQEHRRHGRAVDAERVQAKADALALATMRQHPLFDPACDAYAMRSNIRRLQQHIEAIKRALDGEDPAPIKPDKFVRVHDAAASFIEEHGRLPSASELREMGAHPGDVADVQKHIEARRQAPITAPLKRGRKRNE